MELEDLYDAINAEFGFREYNITIDGIPYFVVHCKNRQEFQHVLDLVEQFPEICKRMYALPEAYSDDLSCIAVYLRTYGAMNCIYTLKYSVEYADFIRIYNNLNNEANQPAVFELPPAAVLLSQMQI